MISHSVMWRDIHLLISSFSHLLKSLERLYPEQPKHPKQKYRLTEAAKEWKNKKIREKTKNNSYHVDNKNN